MGQIMGIIRALRNIRSEFGINPGAPLKAILLISDNAGRELVSANQHYIKQMAGVRELEIMAALANKPTQALTALTSGAEIYVPLEGVIDLEKETARLEKELKGAQTELEKAEAKLNNDSFLARAPQAVIDKEKAKAEEARLKKEGLLQRLEILKKG